MTDVIFFLSWIDGVLKIFPVRNGLLVDISIHWSKNMSDNAKDRRKYPRFEINQIVEISLLKETFFNAESLNVSEGGILCKSRYETEPLSQIFIMFDLYLKEKTYAIKSDGVVVRCDRDTDGLFLIGIQFEDISREDQDKIREYLKENQE